MLMIAYFRERLGEYVNAEIIKKLQEELWGVDYIVAPIADNRMFEIIDQFIDGEITDIQCQHCLSATNLGKQYVFISEKAIKQVEILEQCYLANAEKEAYLTSRQENYEMNRDKVRIARRQYREQGNHIEDILRCSLDPVNMDRYGLEEKNFTGWGIYTGTGLISVGKAVNNYLNI